MITKNDVAWESVYGDWVAKRLVEQVKKGDMRIHCGIHVEIGDYIYIRHSETRLVTPPIRIVSKAQAGVTSANCEFTIDCDVEDFAFKYYRTEKEEYYDN